MRRTIDGFHQDEHGDWVAEISCLHNQHIRHEPPWQDRSWVNTELGRRERRDTFIECPLCDRAELPEGLQVVRSAGPFNASSLPDALQRDHRVAARTWGRLRVIEGSLLFSMDTNPFVRVDLHAGSIQPIPPGVAHSLAVTGPVVVVVDFLVRAGSSARA